MQEFYRPIITPFELQIALQRELAWTGRYVLDFERVLAENAQLAAQVTEERAEEHDADQPTFSLVTGTYRHAKRYGGT
jgi:diphthamide biosynthesis protein 2